MLSVGHRTRYELSNLVIPVSMCAQIFKKISDGRQWLGHHKKKRLVFRRGAFQDR
jgi:hypothetical protein